MPAWADAPVADSKSDNDHSLASRTHGLLLEDVRPGTSQADCPPAPGAQAAAGAAAAAADSFWGSPLTGQPSGSVRPRNFSSFKESLVGADNLIGAHISVNDVPNPALAGGQNADQEALNHNDAMDLKEVLKELHHPELEAGISAGTLKALMRDADLHAPEKHLGKTTYFLSQIGVTDRPTAGGDNHNGKYYLRDVEVSVPDGAKNLKEAEINFLDRQTITEDKYTSLINREKQREQTLFASSEMNVYSHGIFTYSKTADMQGLLLELTTGFPTVVVDWSAGTRPDHVIFGSRGHYMQDRAAASEAGPKLEPLIDKTIDTIGAKNTTKIGFSHGGMFDARYLRHRAETHMEKVNTVVFDHPDIEIRSIALKMGESSNPQPLLSEVASRSFVIGGTHDKALALARLVPGAAGERIGDDSARSRKLIEWEGAMSVSEFVRQDWKSDQHVVNYAGISELLHSDPSGIKKSGLQKAFEVATANSRTPAQTATEELADLPIPNKGS